MGGIFLLIPGVLILVYFHVWDVAWVVADPSWLLLYLVVLAPPMALVAVGVLVIAIGARRYRVARS